MEKNVSSAKIPLTRLTFPDLLVICLIIAFSTGFILHTQFGLAWQPADASGVSIYREGVLFKHLDLNQDQDLELLDGKMVVEIKENRVKVKKSDCPHQLCVRAGSIKRSGESIVCVPYRTLIEIKNAGRQDVDAVVR